MNEERLQRVVAKHLKLLALEENAEREEQQTYLSSLSRQQLQQRGVALYNLRATEQRTGLAGKLIVEFSNPNTKSLPAHVMRVGDVVELERPGKTRPEDKVGGIVCRVREESISVALKEGGLPAGVEDGMRLIKLANDAAFRRLRYALEKLAKLTTDDRCFNVASVIFGDRKEAINTLGLDLSSKDGWYNPGLNELQKMAVRKALNAAEIALIHGPPGTGKTETLIEVIRQLVKPKLGTSMRSNRVLVCGPSNLSVDNIVERLGVDGSVGMVRVGHPARVLDAVLHHTMDFKLAAGDAAALVKDIRGEIDVQMKQLSKVGVMKRQIYAELKDLRRELVRRERTAMDCLIDKTSVVLSTLNMTGSELLKRRSFDVVVIDEAGQALEAECWLAILLGAKVILAGDHCQLPPTVSCAEAAEGGLDVTLFERLAKRNPELVSLLPIQYRMNEIIMKWASDEMYGGRLIADKSVCHHRLCEDPLVENNDATAVVMKFIDTAGFDMDESATNDDGSKCNEGEAKLVKQHLDALLASRVAPKSIAVITPYNAQVALIESLLAEDAKYRGLEIGSGMQFF